ncbi:MAG: hypothetical protein DWH79_10820 [Planctomycetota bacterium]|nr:MAG: hypothetical protein DWH79_10820 [Planctomycetota bacterium]
MVLERRAAELGGDNARHGTCLLVHRPANLHLPLQIVDFSGRREGETFRGSSDGRRLGANQSPLAADGGRFGIAFFGIKVSRGTSTASERASVWRAAVQRELAVWESIQPMATTAGWFSVGTIFSLSVSLAVNASFTDGVLASAVASDRGPP